MIVIYFNCHLNTPYWAWILSQQTAADWNNTGTHFEINTFKEAFESKKRIKSKFSIHNTAMYPNRYLLLLTLTGINLRGRF